MDVTAIPAHLDDSVRARLAELATVVLPGGDGMPGAEEAEVTGTALDRVLAARPDLSAALRRAAAPRGEPRATVAALERNDPATLEALAFVLSCAYVQSAAVRASLGYPGQVPLPRPGVVDLAEMLAPVRARGPRFVPTPAEDR
ncbi:MAG: hypothetical protein JSS97_00590 [Actinobacteria bacterium]|nr:hypothetical protein [Actinomycetota bacterium]